MDGYTIGVDIGGTKISIASVNNAGMIKEKILVPTDVKGGVSAIKTQIIGGILEIIKKEAAAPLAIGIGLAGQIDSEKGVVLFAPNLKWQNIPFKEDLQNALNLSVYVTNDVKAATWGEWIFGAGSRCANFVCLFVGTGIGGGIVAGGMLIEGDTNSAGEFGHMVICQNGRKCHCGRYGCLEAYAGGWAIAERAKELVKSYPEKGKAFLEIAGVTVNDITTHHAVACYIAKNPLALELINEVEDALIIGSVNIVNALNPQKLILGGGVIEGMPHLVSKIDAGVRALALASATKRLEVLKAYQTTQAGVIGAAVFARQQKEKKK